MIDPQNVDPFGVHPVDDHIGILAHRQFAGIGSGARSANGWKIAQQLKGSAEDKLNTRAICGYAAARKSAMFERSCSADGVSR